MPETDHLYGVKVTWTGNLGAGTAGYAGYSRDHVIEAPGKPAISGSSDPAFRGDVARWNPEELLLASLSACHKLWYLGLCAQAGIAVLAYEDVAEGVMREQADGAGQFTAVTLQPTVTIAAGADAAMACALHERAHEMCFIARSVKFLVDVVPTIEMAAG
jgi:organic hydroperoxide reductase OsmC/OhrA